MEEHGSAPGTKTVQQEIGEHSDPKALFEAVANALGMG
jgi:hypothetical protein